MIEFAESTRTAEEAAQRAGCHIGQIVKSMVFKRKDTGGPVLVLTSGSNRVDEQRLAAHLGEAVERAEPDLVRAATGYAIGGVPPIGHATQIQSVLDEDLLRFDLVWAAAGNPKAMFSVAPQTLREMSGAVVLRIRA